MSVHVSTYQHVDFIRDCLDSALMQETDFPFEIIIGEDESDDGTRKICKEYADQHPEQIRLFLHRRENNIAIHGRPTGRFQFMYSYYVARGKYIATCEGDDYWTDPMKLQRQAKSMNKIQGCSLSFHGWKYNDSNEVQERPHLCSSMFDLHEIDFFEPSTEMLSMDAFLFYQLKKKGRDVYLDNINPSIHVDTKEGIYSSHNLVYKSLYSAISRVKMYKIYGEEEALVEKLVYWTTTLIERSFLYGDKKAFLSLLTQIKNEAPALFLNISLWKGIIRGVIRGIKSSKA